jgi:hypothetical protein
MKFLVDHVNENEPQVKAILSAQEEKARREEEERLRHQSEEAMNEYRAKRMQENLAEPPKPVKKKKVKPPESNPISPPEGPPLPVPPPAEDTGLSSQSPALNSSLLNPAEEKAAQKPKKCLCC